MPETGVPLRRNRAFLTLQVGRWTSTLGTQLSTFAYPLLVLATTGSAIGSGAVVAAKLAPYALMGPVAGAVADRFDRRRIMLIGDGGRALVLAAMAGLVVSGQVQTWHIAVVAFAEGCGAVFFTAAQSGLVRAVVPKSQLRAAAGVDAARVSAVRVAGPPLGGVLFAVGRALPFLVDAVTYVVSFLALVRLRTSVATKRAREHVGLFRSIADGWSYLREQRVLLTCVLVLSLSSFAIPGAQLLLILSGHREGLSAQTLGVLVAAVGVAAMAGAASSTFITTRLSLRATILLELWSCLAGVVFLIWPSTWLLLPSLLLQSFLAPVTDAAVAAYTMGNVPDELLGRVTSTTMTLAAMVAPLGPVITGVLVGLGSPRAGLALFIALGVVLAVWTTAAHGLRTAHWVDQEAEVT